MIPNTASNLTWVHEEEGKMLTLGVVCAHGYNQTMASAARQMLSAADSVTQNDSYFLWITYSIGFGYYMFYKLHKISRTFYIINFLPEFHLVTCVLHNIRTLFKMNYVFQADFLIHNIKHVTKYQYSVLYSITKSFSFYWEKEKHNRLMPRWYQ